jgi:hypothetical protein
VPLSWLLESCGPAIKYRTLRDLAPEGFATSEALELAAEETRSSKISAAIVRKQRPTGIWSSNMLGLAPSASKGIKDVGTISQYRRLIQLGWSKDDRPLKLTSRTLFRLLARDPDPALLFEYRSTVKQHPISENWIRHQLREAASAALAEAGFNADPRLRGSAHRTSSAISQFLRSPQSEKPFVKAGSQQVLYPDAHPPTWYSLAMVAAMPNLRRERAGFIERLGSYLAHKAPTKPVILKWGKKIYRPAHVLLGNPLKIDAKGGTPDVPLTIYHIELLAKVGAMELVPSAIRALARLLRDCDVTGVWHPKNLRSQPKATNKATVHYYPLYPVDKEAASRQADVTFRLALIAKELGLELSYT